MARIAGVYDAQVKKGKLAQAERDRRMGLLLPVLKYDAIGSADIVIEAVFERMDVKLAVFAELDRVMKQGAILATNTSTLDVNTIARATKRPGDVLGTHFFSPANVMRLLEIVRGTVTARDVLATALALGKTLGKVSVVSGVCDGFIGNRMLEHYGKQANFLLEEGASPRQVDAAMEAFGFAMGPFKVGDLAGNDIGWNIRKRRRAEKPGYRFSALPDKLCELGRFGQKTGAGWYEYPDGRKPLPSKTVDELIVGAPQGVGYHAAEDRRRGDRRPAGVRAGQRGRTHPRRGHRGAFLRHRRGLSHRLWLSRHARRADVPCGCGRSADWCCDACASSRAMGTAIRSSGNPRRSSSGSWRAAGRLPRYRARPTFQSAAGGEGSRGMNAPKPSSSPPRARRSPSRSAAHST